MIGSKLGPYELLEEVGRGGMATVYRAYARNTDRFVAVKVIHRAISLDSKSMERFTREARLIARLEHPHILPVYDYDGQNDPPYIVMRYLPTGTLKDIMERGQLPFHEIGFLLSQIASALDYAHRQSVIHRDIKPSNIMVDGDGNAFLTDFGIARMTEGSGGASLTGSGMAIGTPGYMAPEQSLGIPIDGRADIYSLGVMVYEMLTGQVPFTAETPMAVILKHINDPVPEASRINPHLPPGVNAVIMRAMAKRPEERYPTATEFSRALSGALGPVEDSTPVQLRAAAAQTIQELEKVRARQQQEQKNRPTNPEVLTDTGRTLPPRPGMTPAPAGATPPPAGGTPPPAGATPTPSSTGPVPPPGTSGAAARGAIIGAVAVIVVLALLGGGFLLITNKNNTDATNTAQFGTLYAGQTSVVQLQTDSVKQTEDSDRVRQFTLTAAANAFASATATNLTPRPTATFTATATNSLTPSITNTPAATSTGTITPVTPSATYTASLTNSATFTPTYTFTPTFTATLTPTSTETPVPPTLTPTLTATAEATQAPIATTAAPTVAPVATTAVPILTPTPQPRGRMPYVNDFETADSLTDWDYDPASWRIQTDSGNAALVGVGGIKSFAVVLGKDQAAEWLDANTTDLLLSMSIYLEDSPSGARVIFRYSESGYYVLEMLPGSLRISRGSGGGQGPNRSNEQQLATLNNAPIRSDAWYQIMLWVDSSRVYLYIDHTLALTAQDSNQALPGGSILLQTFSKDYRVRFDNIKIQRPLPASQHFSGSEWPSTWDRTSITSAKIQTDSRGKGYIEITSGDVRPINPPLTDALMACRIQSLAGGLDIRMREGAGGAYEFVFDAGNMTLKQLDGSGKVVKQWPFANFYGRSKPFDFIVETIGDQIRLYTNGDVFAQTVQNAPPSGDIRFSANAGDQFRINDCLFAETAKTKTEDASWAFDKIKQVESRKYYDGLSDWVDHFNDPYLTKDWWEGGVNAPGEFKADKTDPKHSTYVEIPYKDGASWRMFRNVFFFYGAGKDKVTFFDSSDIYLRVNIRLPQAGTGWAAIRTSTSLGGGTLDGFRVAVTKDAGGNYRVVASGFTRAYTPILYDGPMPTLADGKVPDWITLLLISWHDKVALFANGHFLGAASGIPILSGTAALGVEKDSVADFDEFELRDVSPETR